MERERASERERERERERLNTEREWRERHKERRHRETEHRERERESMERETIEQKEPRMRFEVISILNVHSCFTLDISAISLIIYTLNVNLYLQMIVHIRLTMNLLSNVFDSPHCYSMTKQEYCCFVYIKKQKTMRG
jgi:hypothetical protein